MRLLLLNIRRLWFFGGMWVSRFRDGMRDNEEIVLNIVRRGVILLVLFLDYYWIITGE